VAFALSWFSCFGIPADKELYQRRIEATDRQIDALVYELYGLTEEEVGIVERQRGLVQEPKMTIIIVRNHDTKTAL